MFSLASGTGNFPFERGELDLLQAPPRAVGMNDLGLEETEDSLGQGVVVRVADAAHRGVDAGLGKPLGVADGYVLDASIAVVDQVVRLRPGMKGLLQGIEFQLYPRSGSVAWPVILAPPEIDVPASGRISRRERLL